MIAMLNIPLNPPFNPLYVGRQEIRLWTFVTFSVND
jgi:hypothetical protein